MKNTSPLLYQSSTTWNSIACWGFDNNSEIGRLEFPLSKSYCNNNPLNAVDINGYHYMYIERPVFIPHLGTTPEAYFLHGSGSSGSWGNNVQDNWTNSNQIPDWYYRRNNFEEAVLTYLSLLLQGDWEIIGNANQSEGTYSFTSEITEFKVWGYYTLMENSLTAIFDANGDLVKAQGWVVSEVHGSDASNDGVYSDGWFTTTGHTNNGIGGFGAGMSTSKP